MIIEQYNVNDCFQRIMNMTNTKSINSEIERKTNIYLIGIFWVAIF
jgi:hypothetical protein